MLLLAKRHQGCYEAEPGQYKKTINHAYLKTPFRHELKSALDRFNLAAGVYLAG
jgi:hypothetical protein